LFYKGFLGLASKSRAESKNKHLQRVNSGKGFLSLYGFALFQKFFWGGRQVLSDADGFLGWKD
jgi:hypothetical protein